MPFTRQVTARIGSAARVIDGGHELSMTEHSAQVYLPDVSFIDVALPGGAIHATAHIVERGFGRVVLISKYAGPYYELLDALRAGASGHLAKAGSVSRFAEIIRGVMAGESIIHRDAVSYLVDEFRARPGGMVDLPGHRRVHLTHRERDVLRLLRAGLSTSQVGHRLGIAPVTVRTHIMDLKRKLSAPNRRALIALDLTGTQVHVEP